MYVYDEYDQKIVNERVAQYRGQTQRFLDGKLKFTEIVPACRAVLEQHEFDPRPTLPQLLQLDRWAREEVTRWARY